MRSSAKRPVRPATVAAALIVGALTSNVLAYQTLTGLVGDLHLVPARAARPVVVPRPVARVAAPVVAVRTPADRVLAAVTGSSAAALLGPGWAAQAASPTLYGAPFGHGCGTSLPVAPVSGWSRSGRGDGASATVQLWAFPAGQGAAALSRVRAALDGCDGPLTPWVSDGGLPGAASAFTAVASPGGQGVVWLVWQRGDVLGAVTYTSMGGARPAAARGMSGRVDAALRAALAPVCADLSPALADATRNPALPGYTPYSRDEQLALPAVTVTPTPAVSPAPALPVPDPVAHPDLAVPQPAPDSAYTDTDGDGFAETPPPLSAATLEPAPVFPDPAAFTAPDGAVTTDPAEPARPTAPPSSAAVHIPVADVSGPGCGWAFTGATAPQFDTATLTARGQALIAARLASASADVTRFEAADQAWAAAYRSWATAHAAYQAYAAFVAARDAASAAQHQAQVAHDKAVAAYTTVRVPPTTTATPKPTPSATAPTPAPTAPAPTPSSTPTATGIGGLPR